MNQNHRKVGRVLLLAVVAMSVAGAGVGGPLVALDGWLEARSPNLRLITDLEPARADELLKQLEALRSSVAGELFGRPVPRRLPTTIVVFAEDPSYAPFRVADREGQFYSTLFESLVVLNGGAESRPLEMAAAHEYTHAIVTEMEIALPLWLHEGLAEYYSTFRLEEGVVAVGIGVGGRSRTREKGEACAGSSGSPFWPWGAER